MYNPPVLRSSGNHICIRSPLVLRVWRHRRMSGDIEFSSSTVFMDNLKYFNLKFELRPARNHNKNSTMDAKHWTLRRLVLHLLSSALEDCVYQFEPLHDTDDLPGQEPAPNSLPSSSSLSVSDVLARPCFLSNTVYGGKILSVLALVGGYPPSLSGIPKTPLSDDLCRAHIHQTARRAIYLLLNDLPDAFLPDFLFPKNQELYYFVRDKKFGTWHTCYVRVVHDDEVELASSPDHKGSSNRVAFQYLRFSSDNGLVHDHQITLPKVIVYIRSRYGRLTS